MEKNPNFNLRIFKTQEGGLDFLKMSKFQITLRPHHRKGKVNLKLKMSEFDPRGRGVKHFSNISEIQKF